MRTDYFHFKKSDQGTEYVTFSEGITKTRQSGLHNKHRLVIPKMFVTDTERCLVRFCKLYLFKRLKCLQNNGPFCLSVIVSPKSGVWYKVTPVGVNEINEIKKEIAANSNLEGNKCIANHSARKTPVKKLNRRDETMRIMTTMRVD